MPFDQGDDIAVLRSAELVAFPVTRHGPVFYGSGSFPDRIHIRDLAALLLCMPRATDGPPGPQMQKKLLFQHAAGLHIQATIDGLVRHVAGLSPCMRSASASPRSARATNCLPALPQQLAATGHA